ncbi:hypothetical protein Ahy_B03g066616 [Arachis hypogaea]|uniref:At2g35280-like TPR domain-containing protein n=1 Tax=Arachis hypogaea TaxID=3818 RepID=A0A445A4P0_ARAHY|nr:hypothetical protein Ahy_B03g066616 [Arachis hypogaea]
MDFVKDKMRRLRPRELNSKGRSPRPTKSYNETFVYHRRTTPRLWLVIAIKVTSNSIEDLCRFCMTCCAAHDVGDEDTVLRMVAIPPPHEMNWWWIRNPIRRRFFERCFEIGHPELLFREVLWELYIRRNHAIGWEILQNVASNGLDAAKYALSMELLIRRDDSKAKKMVWNYFECLKQVAYSPYVTRVASRSSQFLGRMKSKCQKREKNIRCLTRGHMGLLYEYCRRAAERGSVHGVGGADHIRCIRYRADYEVERYVDIPRV